MKTGNDWQMLDTPPGSHSNNMTELKMVSPKYHAAIQSSAASVPFSPVKIKRPSFFK